MTNTRQDQAAPVRDRIDRAMAHVAAGELEPARALYDELKRHAHNELPILDGMAELARLLGDRASSAHYYQRIVEQHPQDAHYLGLLGRALINSGQHAEGEKVLREAIRLDPQSPGAFSYLGKFKFQTGDNEQAATLLQHATSLDPDNASNYAPLAGALSVTDRHDEAMQVARKLISLKPDAPSYSVLIRLLIEAGETGEAEQYIHKALESDHTYGPIYIEMKHLRKYTRDDMELIGRIEKVLDEELTAKDRAFICFTLGKMLDDIGEWDRAFEHYRSGNELKKPANQDSGAAGYHQILKRYLTQTRCNGADHGSDDSTPVFIVGMPRSGSTLMEQIIASHPQAEGAGELMQMGRTSIGLIPGEATDSTVIDNNLSRESLRRAAHDYLQKLRSTREGAARIVDKMPDNFNVIGLIHLMFPNATIIHSIRDPLDTCLSCYFQPFRDVRWSFDLGSIVQQYRTYREVMNYWKQILPAGRIIDVHYEDLVSDPEASIRRLVTSTGLDWDEHCLRFQHTRRNVNTASMSQVRQGLYRSSKKRWHNYAEHIGELAAGIRDYISDDDAALLESRGGRLPGTR